MASTLLTVSSLVPSMMLKAPVGVYTYTPTLGVVVESAWLPNPDTGVRVPVAIEVSERRRNRRA